MVINEIVRRVWLEFEPELASHGYELVEVEYGPERGTCVLRLFIDKPGGVTLDDCQTVSHLVSALLDAADFISEKYCLEISSPGFDRPLRKPCDFERFAGERVKVVLASPVEGRKRFSGVLKGFSDGLIALDCGGQAYEVHIENVKKANLDR
jgi:ribosome maturation factor RimP